MKKIIRLSFAVFLAAALALSFFACGKKESSADDAVLNAAKNYEGSRVILLGKDGASLDGSEIREYDYTWHADPSVSHTDVKNSPAEYYTGTKPKTDAAAYIDRDLQYYPSLPADGFKLVNYDGEQEWAYYYCDGEHDGYIFATLPGLGKSIPTQMMHTEEEAAENKVLHITEAGTYVLSGEWKGQIRVDLGDQDDVFSDESARVTLVLCNADISCSVAPGVVFYSVYESDNTWEVRSSVWGTDVDAENAGAVVVIADGTVNTVSGTNVFRMLKTKYKYDDDTSAVKLQKKAVKTDGALYSYMTMKITGEREGSGKLTVNAGYEGIDSELHLAVNGGSITINSQDDGINVNEDYVSVVFINGGYITINAGQGAEGDGIDSNGYVVINGGTLEINGVTAPDSAVDSELGITYNGGRIIIDGKETVLTPGQEMQDISSGNQGMGPGMKRPENAGSFGNSGFDIRKFKEDVAKLGDDATLEDVLKLLGMDVFDPQNDLQPGSNIRPVGPGNFNGDFPVRPDDPVPGGPPMPDGGAEPVIPGDDVIPVDPDIRETI